MHRSLRQSSFAVLSLVLVGALVGCGSAEEEAPVAGPPPSEAVVFDASNDTKAELGIVKWGFATDADGDQMTYRGYGASNEVLTTVVQTMDRRDDSVYHFALKMTGPKGEASEKIDFSTRPSDNGKDTLVMMLVTENTFQDGSTSSRVLDRFKADGGARKGFTTNSGGSLVGKTRPLDGPLVTPCSSTVDRCQVELIDSRIAAAAAAGDCGLLKRVGIPLVGAVVGGLVTGLATLWTGPGAVVGAAGGAIGGAVAGSATAEVQCFASRRDATAAAAELRTCQQRAQAACTP